MAAGLHRQAARTWRVLGFTRLKTMPPQPPPPDSTSAKPIESAQTPAISPASELWNESLERAARLLRFVLKIDCESQGKAGESKPGQATPSVQLLTLPPIENVADWVSCADVSMDESHESYRQIVRDRGGSAYAVVPIIRRDGTPMKRWNDGSPSGSLCVVLSGPRKWTDADRESLTDVATLLASELELCHEQSRHQALENELRQNALRDSLTGLPNSVLFLDRLEHAVERARRHKDFRFAVLALDLDRFKGINNSLGRSIGDDVLVAVARRLEACVRGEDTVARASGDEFAILLESLSDDSDGSRVAERMQRSLAAPVETSEGEVYTAASMGIVLSSSGLDTPTALMQQAGIAMTRAKSAGRGRYEMYDRAMHVRALARLRMETDLRHALERDEFEIYYQPLITLSTGRITELEALIRWHHPQRGLVAPLEFIPLAEETGMIVPIGGWVLAEACRQTRDWQLRFPRQDALALSVNLSPKQFAQPGFVPFVENTVRTSGLDPRSLKLEITESFAIDDPDGTRELLTALRALGIQIYLDDFGTGYSSLGYLHRLPLDGIKIDRCFVTQMDVGPLHRQLVHTVRDLAMNIGVAAVAEGVETSSQLDALRSLGCESAQGFLFSRPVPRDIVERLLTDDPRW
jgi:diguanylate cyclase (GGDEF)-like protein